MSQVVNATTSQYIGSMNKMKGNLLNKDLFIVDETSIMFCIHNYDTGSMFIFKKVK